MPDFSKAAFSRGKSDSFVPPGTVKIIWLNFPLNNSAISSAFLSDAQAKRRYESVFAFEKKVAECIHCKANAFYSMGAV